MMEASPWWWSLRQQPHGQEVMRDLLHQMLSALAVLQQANVTHRYACTQHHLVLSLPLSRVIADQVLTALAPFNLHREFSPWQRFYWQLEARAPSYCPLEALAPSYCQLEARVPSYCPLKAPCDST